MDVIWLPAAEEALDSIYRFYMEKSLQAARRIISDILNSTQRLIDYPEMAAIEQILKNHPIMFRSLVVRKTYKVVYYVEGNRIYIADVWDCRQNPVSLRERMN
jgi:plasmid stabilization system protein ParE